MAKRRGRQTKSSNVVGGVVGGIVLLAALAGLSNGGKPRSTNIPSPTATRIVTATVPSTEDITIYTTPKSFHTTGTLPVNVYSCADKSCSAVFVYAPGRQVSVIGEIEGQSIGGKWLWYVVNIDGENQFIHSGSLGLSTSSNSPNVSTPRPTREPMSTVRPPSASSGASCGGASTCTQMNSCAQAYACLPSHPRLDGDGDGVPCESICSGG